MRPRGERPRVGADLVRGVTVRRDAIGPDQHQVHLAALDQVRRRGVRDQRVRHPLLAQLPGGEPGALEPRARLAHPHERLEAGPRGAVHRSQRRAPVLDRQPSGVAVREDAGAAPEQFQPVRADRGGGRDLGRVEGARRAEHRRRIGRRGPHRLEPGAQVDRGRTRAGDPREGGVERLPAPRGEREPVGGEHPDQRGPAHRHVLDRARRVLDRRGRPDLDAARQRALVEVADAVLRPLDRAHLAPVHLHDAPPAPASARARWRTRISPAAAALRPKAITPSSWPPMASIPVADRVVSR